MTAPQPGFNPQLAMPPPYPSQQFAHPGQQFAPPGQQFAPPGQQFAPPGQQFAAPGAQYAYQPGYEAMPTGQPFQPQSQYPPPILGQPQPATTQYAPPPGGQPANFGTYGPPPMPIMPMRIPMSGDNAGDKDEDLPGFIRFTDKAVRAAFIRKVYMILMLQLTFSLAVICLFVFEKHVKFFVRHHTGFYYMAYFIFLGVYIALACCSGLRRNYPCNMIMLFIFTAAMSYMLGTISSMYDTEIVLKAVGICAAVCLAVSVFSFHTKFDFTSCGGVLFILVWVLFLFGIICIFTRNSIMSTIYAGCGALLFTLFLAHDTQMLMGGKKHELSPEEHIFASMQIYLDIVYIFIFLLAIFSSGKD